MATKIPLLDLPYRQARGDGGRRSLTQLLVIHATDNSGADDPRTKVDEAAENEASYASHRPDAISAHLFIDDDSAVQCVRLDHVAYGCYPTGNSRSIQLELAGRSGHLTPATIARAANFAAIICHSWALPIRRLTAPDLRRGTKGICGHADVTAAWHTGRDAGASHTDPGAFPWNTFLARVKTVTASLYAPPAPPPATFDPITTIDGDRLDLLARTFYGNAAKAAQIKADNHLISDALHPGQTLRIRKPHKPVHHVVSGDTAWAVAQKAHLLLSVLTTMNQHRVSDMNKLAIGMWLRIG
jgi:LysM repeat protein